MEPLAVLREFASTGRLAQVTLSADSRTVKFGDQFEFGADAPTRWRAKGVAAVANADSTATLPLGALAFFATSATFAENASYADYLRNARSAGLPTVAVVDRKPLTSYLLGQYDGADHLVAITEAVPAAAAVERKRKHEDGAEAAPAPAAAALAAKQKRAPSPSSPLDPLAVTRSLELSLRDRNSQMLSAATAAGGGVGGGVNGSSNGKGNSDSVNVGFSSILEVAERAAHVEKLARASRPQGGPSAAALSAGRKQQQQRGTSSRATVGTIAALPSRRYERDRAGGTATTTETTTAQPMEGLDEFGELGLQQAYGGAEARARARERAENAQAEAAAAAAAERQQQRLHQQRPPASHSSLSRRKAGGAPSSSASRPGGASTAGAGVSGGLPIIVVPAAATARINMLNAPAFFSEGSFTPAEVLRSSGAKKESSTAFCRRVAVEGGAEGSGALAAAAVDPSAPPKPNYFVTDRTDNFRSLDWSRVVAVVVSGAAWQFKGWPFRGLDQGHTVDLFGKVAGLFVHYADEEPPAAVKTWNVSRYALHRDARHRDRSVASSVWRAIDASAAAKRAREGV